MLQSAGKCRTRPIPAGPTKVKEYILEILRSGQPLKRDELISRTRALAGRDGFILDAIAAVPNTKKALRLLADEGSVESPRVGWWRITERNRIPELPALDLPISYQDKAESESEPRITIQREIGKGAESVYVYYHDAYAELARLKGAAVWECKIGSTLGDPDVRVIGQGALTAFPRPPVVGLVIRSDNGRALERAIHNALDSAGQRVEGGAGSEWFLTSPDRVERWVLEFWNSLGVLQSHAGPVEPA